MAACHPSKMNNARKLYKPNRVARDRGISNNNKIYIVDAVPQNTGLINKFKCLPLSEIVDFGN